MRRDHETVEEFSLRFRVPTSTVRRWAQKGIIPAIKVGKQWEISLTAVPPGRSWRGHRDRHQQAARGADGIRANRLADNRPLPLSWMQARNLVVNWRGQHTTNVLSVDVTEVGVRLETIVSNLLRQYPDQTVYINVGLSPQGR